MTTADGRSGSTVGKYRLHEVVGRGGMGVVYRAEHVYIGREVAVKILHEGYGGREESIKRFLREARAASLINHPNIVEVTDFGKANDGTVFFVMELLVGEPLDAILARERRLDLLRSIIICNQLTAALAAAHSKGIIHRDLKPENVMLIPREGRRELVRRVADESGAYELSEREKQFDFVKILDFGVAKVREPDAEKSRTTKAGVVFGTPEYMAPETARVGYSDARSDIYALGIMFYEMMTGIVPFTAESAVEVMMKQVNERVPPMRKVAPDAEITEDAERMILKALAKDPEQRHQSMEEFYRDLQKCYGQLRFRRTLRTPTVNQANTPAVTTIPLTKKKKRATPSDASGAVGEGGAPPTPASPSPSSATESSSANLPTRPRSLTPRLPGLPLNASAPILLTKKKPLRAPADLAPGSERSREREAHRQLYADVNAEADSDNGNGLGGAALAADDQVVSPDAVTREIPQFALNARAYFARASETKESPTGGQIPLSPSHEPDPASASPPKKKRTTLPLGLNQDSRATEPAGTSTTLAALAEGDQALAQGDDRDPMLIALPGLARDKASGSSGAAPVTPSAAAVADSNTPRVSLVPPVDADPENWRDEPTSPAAPEYPPYPDKVG